MNRPKRYLKDEENDTANNKYLKQKSVPVN